MQCTDVVFVTVRGHKTFDAVGVFAQPGEIGQHEVDAVHVGIGEHQPDIDQQHPTLLLDRHAVAADLAETAEEDDPDRRAAHRASG
jgi:hypothetical protein